MFLCLTTEWGITYFATSLQIHFFAVVDFFARPEFVFASFYVAYVIANLSMVKINSNIGQTMTTLSDDT